MKNQKLAVILIIIGGGTLTGKTHAVGRYETLRVQPTSTPFFVPPHTRGDREFKGHGPNVSISVKLSIYGNQIWANVSMHAEETKSDWTTASGHSSYLIYEHNTQIVQINSQTTASLQYRDSNGHDDFFWGIPSSIVSSYRCVGDTGSSADAGSRTGVEISFKPISISAVAGGRAKSPGSLKLLWMGVVDNGEGDGRSWYGYNHGPHGNLHCEIFNVRGQRLSHFVIPGPSFAGPNKPEWVDLDAKRFGNGFVLHRWSRLDDVVRVKIWESDPGIGRSNDVLFDSWIYRRSTSQQPTLLTEGNRIAADDVKAKIQRGAPQWYYDCMRHFGFRYPPKLFMQVVSRN